MILAKEFNRNEMARNSGSSSAVQYHQYMTFLSGWRDHLLTS